MSATPLEPGGDRASECMRSFYDALRRIECARRELPRIGEARVVAEEPVRLGQRPSLAFQAHEIVDEERQGLGVPSRLNVTFFGAFGASGPLPLHLTEFAYQRIHHGNDNSFARFVDLFHHRLISFFYRAWASAQPTASHDRPEDDPFARFVGALIGQTRTRAQQSRELPDERELLCLHMAGHLVGRTRHPEGLQKLLSEYFDVTVSIEEFVGEWLDIPDEYCWRLPRGDALDAAFGVLGRSTTVGRAVWQRQHKFRVVIGPLTRARYESFLPGASNTRNLIQLVQLYIGHELAWDVRLQLSKEDMAPAVLGRNGRVGATSYLGPAPGSDARPWDDLIIEPLAHAS